MSDSKQSQGINTELWEFPCTIAFKTMAINRPNIDVEILEVIQRVLPGDYSPTLKPSAKGNYVSVTATVTFHTKEQVETLYREMRSHPDVKMCL
jgi:hypothetical protein